MIIACQSMMHVTNYMNIRAQKWWKKVHGQSMQKNLHTKPQVHEMLLHTSQPQHITVKYSLKATSWTVEKTIKEMSFSIVKHPLD
jgi:hypothetical protein